MKIAAIADPDTIIGLRLAGVRDSYPVENAEQAEQALRKISQDQSIGLVIFAEKIADKIRRSITDFTSSANCARHSGDT